MGWLQLVGSIKLQVSFAKEPYKRDDILQRRPVILSILLIVATQYVQVRVAKYESTIGKRRRGWLKRGARQ